MADQEYERDEQLLEARRLKRLELKRKRMIRKRITLGAIFLVLVVLIIVIFKSCGKKDDQQADPPPTEPENSQQDELPAQTATATLSAVGDIMVYDSQLEDALQSDGTYQFLPSFAPISTLLTASDVTVGNFEANLAGPPYSGKPDFRAPESLATTLAGLGFDILQTANTYSIQNGLSGLTGTINAIRSEGMDSLGTYLSADDKAQNQVVVKEVNGIRMAFLGFTKGLNNLTLPEGSDYCVDLLYTDYYTTYNTVDRTAITQAVAAARAQDPDVIIAMVHWGSEYDTAVSSTQEEIADLLFQDGVDVILGTHSHIVGPMEMRTVTVDGKEKNVFIAYSLGNFLAAMERDDQTYLRESVVLNLEFTNSGDETTMSNVDYVPVYLFDNGADAVNRYELRAVYDVRADQPDAETQTLMEQALTHLKANTASDYERGASGDAPTDPTTPSAGDTGGTE